PGSMKPATAAATAHILTRRHSHTCRTRRRCAWACWADEADATDAADAADAADVPSRRVAGPDVPPPGASSGEALDVFIACAPEGFAGRALVCAVVPRWLEAGEVGTVGAAATVGSGDAVEPDDAV